ncbi:MAG TPA: hypothetical protein VFI31_03005 [Pirellulales bacterium]|nr:hypothetical protein [Pirellulales bacterium]
MSRRFQFSLRAVLLAMLLICLPLGAWQLLKTSGQYIEADQCKLGTPFSVKGRIIRPTGPQQLSYHFRIEERNGQCLINMFVTGAAKKAWPGTYAVDTEIPLLASDIAPGEYRLSLYTLQEHVATCKLSITAP